MSRAADLRSAPALSAARVVGELALWLVAVIVASSALAPPLFALIDLVAPGSFPFSRVFRRVASLVAVLLLWLLLRRWGVRSWADLGWRRRDGAWRQFAIWVGIGAAASVALLGSELLLGTRAWHVELTWSRAGMAVLAAMAIGLVEETVFRGALFLGLVSKLRGWSPAIALVSSVLYSVVHFARGGRGRTPGSWDAGLRLWAEVPGAMAYYWQPAIGLAMLGLLFCAIAWGSRHLAAPAGFHAGAVLALQWLSDLTATTTPDGSFWLADGLQPGWRLAVLMAAAIVLLAMRQRPRRSVEERRGGRERRGGGLGDGGREERDRRFVR